MAALIDNLIGHDDKKEKLLQMARENNLPSTFIFYGPSGVGKKQMVLGLLQVLNCQRDAQACGACNSCLRVFEEKNEFVYYLKLEDKKNISVEQVRELHKFLSLKTMNAARFVIIDPADKLSRAAANSLLKTLEEAPERTHFFLLTEHLSILLPTIRSRSQILRFQPIGRQVMSQIPGINQAAMDWSGGRLDVAHELMEDEALDYLNKSIQLFHALLCPEPQDWKKNFSWFFTNDQWREFCFHIWQQALGQKLSGTNQELQWLPDESEKLSFLFEKMEEMRNNIHRNVDKVLSMENFFYAIKKQADQGEGLWS